MDSKQCFSWLADLRGSCKAEGKACMGANVVDGEFQWDKPNPRFVVRSWTTTTALRIMARLLTGEPVVFPLRPRPDPRMVPVPRVDPVFYRLFFGQLVSSPPSD